VSSTFRIESVDADDPRAVALRRVLDDDLDERYRQETAGEAPAIREERDRALAIHPEQVRATLLAVDAHGEELGHVMLRELGGDWELKRLVVAPAARRRGVGRSLVAAAIESARRGGAHRVILQTGAPQPESIALYRAAGFTPIPVYEPYVATMPDSLCFELRLGDGVG
jgi:ribosomal protein S18 acetylase RimI-like enzyme